MIPESQLTSKMDKMNMVAESKLTSGEVGILWMTYMLESLFSQMVGVLQKTQLINMQKPFKMIMLLITTH